MAERAFNLIERRSFELELEHELYRSPLILIDEGIVGDFARGTGRLLGKGIEGAGRFATGLAGSAARGVGGAARDIGVSTARGTGRLIGKGIEGAAKTGLGAGKWVLGKGLSGAAELGRGLVGAKNKEGTAQTGMHRAGELAREKLGQWRQRRAAAQAAPAAAGDQQTPGQPGAAPGAPAAPAAPAAAPVPGAAPSAPAPVGQVEPKPSLARRVGEYFTKGGREEKRKRAERHQAAAAARETMAAIQKGAGKPPASLERLKRAASDVKWGAMAGPEGGERAAPITPEKVAQAKQEIGAETTAKEKGIPELSRLKSAASKIKKPAGAPIPAEKPMTPGMIAGFKKGVEGQQKKAAAAKAARQQRRARGDVAAEKAAATPYQAPPAAPAFGQKPEPPKPAPAPQPPAPPAQPEAPKSIYQKAADMPQPHKPISYADVYKPAGGGGGKMPLKPSSPAAAAPSVKGPPTGSAPAPAPAGGGAQGGGNPEGRPNVRGSTEIRKGEKCPEGTTQVSGGTSHGGPRCASTELKRTGDLRMLKEQRRLLLLQA